MNKIDNMIANEYGILINKFLPREKAIFYPESQVESISSE